MQETKLLATAFALICSLAFAQDGGNNNGANSGAGDSADEAKSPKTAVARPEQGSKALAIAQARVRDAEAVANLTAEGQALYQADPNKGSFTNYKYGAYALLEKGEFRQAIRKAAVSLYLSVSERNDTQIAYAKLILATAYLASGDLDHAELYASGAKKLYIYPTYRPDVMSTADKILGDVALKQSNFEKAIGFYRESIDGGQGDSRFYSRVALAQVFAKTKRFDEARDSIAKAQNFVEVLPQKQQAAARGSLLRIRGLVALAEGKAAEAAQLYDAALKTQADDENAAYDKFWILEGAAQARIAIGDKQGALKAYLEAVDLSEKVRGRFRSEEVKSALFGDMQDVFGQATRLLVETGQIELAWSVNERGRARSLLDMLRNRVELASGTAVFAEASGKVAKIDDIVAQLKTGDAVLSYRVLDDRTYAWITRKSGTKVVTLSVGGKELIRRVQEFRDAVVDDKSNIKVIGASLHEVLIKPLGLAKGESVAIIPHDALHYLPFQAIWTGDEYLLQKVAISYAPSVSALVRTNASQTSKTGKFFALGNPDLGDRNQDLPGAQREVEALSKLYQNSESYFRSDATRDRFFKGAPQARLVHIAAHGTVDPVDPLYSKLHLAKEANHTGVLEAKEIYSIRLDGTDLIALSACESGLGKVSRGDEVWGFTRSFLSAGAPALLVSLWPVSDDATEMLMKQFYSRLANGVGRRDALRDAELAVLADSRFSSPLFWAAFNLIGDSR